MAKPKTKAKSKEKDLDLVDENFDVDGDLDLSDDKVGGGVDDLIDEGRSRGYVTPGDIAYPARNVGR